MSKLSTITKAQLGILKKMRTGWELVEDVNDIVILCRPQGESKRVRRKTVDALLFEKLISYDFDIGVYNLTGKGRATGSY